MQTGSFDDNKHLLSGTNNHDLMYQFCLELRAIN